MKKIVAIGGGEIGRPGYPVETTAIDREIIRLTGKKHPKLLFIPTASSDSESYYEVIKKHFGKRLGCQTDVLYLINNKISQREIKAKILNTNIVYVGGGNTELMLKIWQKTGVDRILKQAYQKGIVLSGLSAGAICWFKWGNSDSNKFNDPKAKLIKISCLGLVKAICCPHYDIEKDRKGELRKMMKQTAGVAIALDNCCALEILDDKYQIISSKPSANAYKTYWKVNKYYEEVIKKEKELKLTQDLLRRG